MATYQNATRANLDGVQLSSLAFNIFDDANLRRELFIMPNMLNGQPIANYTGKDKITKSASSCSDVTASDILTENVKLIAFKEFEINTTVCPKELVGKMVAKGMKPDSAPDELGAMIAQLTANSASLDLLRLAWLGDTSIASSSLNSGVAVADYNLKDGFYKQASAAVTAGTMSKIVWSDTDVLGTIRKAKRALNFNARRTAKFFCTSGYYDKLANLTVGSNNSIAQQRVIDGIPTLYVDGIEIVELEEASQYINDDFATPFEFGIMSPLENLAVPMDRDEIVPSGWDKDAKSKKYYLEAAYQADFKIANDKFAVLVVAQ